MNIYSPLYRHRFCAWYFVNVERGNIADKIQPRNMNVSFTNNSNIAFDQLIFTFYSDQLVLIDVYNTF
jgi:hypothetical protein